MKKDTEQKTQMELTCSLYGIGGGAWKEKRLHDDTGDDNQTFLYQGFHKIRLSFGIDGQQILSGSGKGF